MLCSLPRMKAGLGVLGSGFWERQVPFQSTRVIRGLPLDKVQGPRGGLPLHGAQGLCGGLPLEGMQGRHGGLPIDR